MYVWTHSQTATIMDTKQKHIPFLSAVTVVQRFRIVPSTVLAQFIDVKSTGLLDETQYVQIVEQRCTQLILTLWSLNEEERISLTTASDEVERPGIIDIPDYENLFHKLKLTFNLKGCPYGFYLSKSLKECVCETSLIDHHIQCNSQTLKIYRSASKWINVTLAHFRENQTSGVMVHDHCPLDYCMVPKFETV